MRHNSIPITLVGTALQPFFFLGEFVAYYPRQLCLIMVLIVFGILLTDPCNVRTIRSESLKPPELS